MRKAHRLLTLARKKFPEQFNQLHGLYLTDEGDMLLCLALGEYCRTFTFEDADLDRDPEDLLADIEALLQGKPS